MGEGSGEEQDIYQRKQHAIVEDWDNERKREDETWWQGRGNTEYIYMYVSDSKSR